MADPQPGGPTADTPGADSALPDGPAPDGATPDGGAPGSHEEHDGFGFGDVTVGYADALARLASVRIDQPTIEDVLSELLQVTQGAMRAPVAISVTSVEADGSLTTVAATGAAARQVDAFEYDIDEGPCITALATGEEQLLDDVATDDRWPRFSQHAAEVGFATAAGLPLRIGERTIGSLNLYAAEISGLEADLATARTLTRPAAIVLANGTAYRRRFLARSRIEDKLDEIAVVHQAVGMLMVQRACDQHAAQQLLVATAQATGRSVEDVAANIVGQVDDA